MFGLVVYALLMTCEICLADEFLSTAVPLTDIFLLPTCIMGQHVLVEIILACEAFLWTIRATMGGISRVCMSSIALALPYRIRRGHARADLRAEIHQAVF